MSMKVCAACCASLLNSGSVLIERVCGGRLLKVFEAK